MQPVLNGPLLQSLNLIYQSSKGYFSRNLKGTAFQFHPKKGGDQLGTIMLMKIPSADSSSKQIKFFIKTHQDGSAKSSGSRQAADLREIFIYKMLEITGFGPKVHFYGQNFSSLFLMIATQDLEFTKRPNVKKLFETYEYLLDSLQWDNPEIIFNFALFDILARLFVLYDVTTNYGNFGRVTIITEAQQYYKFIVPSGGSCIVPDIFEQFVSGNGMFNYTRHYAAVCCDRPLNERLQTGKAIISLFNSGAPRRNLRQSKPPLISAIDQAHIFAVQFSESNPLLKKQQSKLLQYVNDVKTNFTVLSNKINNSH